MKLGESAAVLDALRTAQRILVTSHRNPDGDAIGSELAFAELARALGLDVVIANHDPAGFGLDELPGVEGIHVGPELPAGFPESFDLVVTLECPDIDRPGLTELEALPIINIDHHHGNDLYGAVNWIDEEAPAVGEMVWRLFVEAGIQPSPDAAMCAYVALSTDTGDFRYSNATPVAFTQAAAMVEAGARPEQVSEWIHERRSEASVRLLGECLASLELFAENRIAVISADAAAFERAGASPSDTEGIVNLPRSIATVRAVAFLKQYADQPVRVSLRSKSDLDVGAIAARFGGGGVPNAAGCTVDGDLPGIRDELVAALQELVGE